MLHSGLENLLNTLQKAPFTLGGKRVGYLSNQASTDRNFVQGSILLQKALGARLTTLFSPQHGFFSEKQDNMVESTHGRDAITGLPIYSLYGEYRKPTAEMFSGLDTLLVDLIDVGTRVYTFMYTLTYCLEAAAECGKKVLILDRPNPIGGELVEGNLLQPECSSFVGLHPLPMRHGMTMGELALMFNYQFGVGADLEVIKMSGWQRDMYMRDTGFPWVSPSPNMPTPETALVYPGQVIWEGTKVSEGRGTTLPFEYVGAPYWNHEKILRRIDGKERAGSVLRPIVFEPTSGKYAQQRCIGFQLHITDKKLYRPYRTSLALLQAVMLLYPEDFNYKEPPYEYEFKRLPMDLILGDKNLRQQLESGVSIIELEEEWQPELKKFLQIRENYLLY